MSKVLARWLPGTTLFAWASLLLYFFWSGRLSAFLVPMFRPWVLVAGLLLVVLALVAWILPDEAGCCEGATCNHPPGRMSIPRMLVFLVLLLPVYVAFFLSPDGFGVDAIANRGVLLDASGLGRENAPIESESSYESALPAADGQLSDLASAEPIDPSEYIRRSPEGYLKAEVIDFLYAASEPALRSDFDGEIVDVVGQVVPDVETGAAGNRFRLVRMFMTCCAADARPVGVVVKLNSPTTLTELSWVRVIGRVEFPFTNGKPVAIVSAQKISKTDPPSETMLY